MSANSEGSEDDFKKVEQFWPLGLIFFEQNVLAGLLGSFPGCTTGRGFYSAEALQDISVLDMFL